MEPCHSEWRVTSNCNSLKPQNLSSELVTRRIAFAAFAIIAMALMSAGYWFYTMEVRAMLKEKHQDLSAIGELKAGQIEQWRKERQKDARRLGLEIFTRKAVERFLSEPDNAGQRDDLLQRLKLEVQIGEAVDALLLAPDGKILFAASDIPQPTSPTLQRAVAEAVTKKIP